MKGYSCVCRSEVTSKFHSLLVSGILSNRLEGNAQVALDMLKLPYSVEEVYGTAKCFMIHCTGAFSKQYWVFLTKDLCSVIKPKLWCRLTYLSNINAFVCSFGGLYMWLCPMKNDYIISAEIILSKC